MSKLTLLGTGTCQLQTDRMATSALIELDGLRIVYDMGRGIAHRLTELGFKNNDIRHIVFSHFHADHISDLIPFLQAASWSQIDPRTVDLHIYGPRGVKVQIMRLISLFGPDELNRPTFEVHIHEIRADTFEIEGREFFFDELPPANNHGLKFIEHGRTIALTGDSHFHDAEVRFLRGVDLAVIDSGHLTDDELIQLAADSQAKEIVCSHLYRELNARELGEMAEKKGFTGKFAIARDLMKFEI